MDSNTCGNMDDDITENLCSVLDDNSAVCMAMCEKSQEYVNNENMNMNNMNETGEQVDGSVINDKGSCTVMGGNYKEFVTVRDLNDMIGKGTCADDEITKNMNFVISHNGGCVVVGGKCNKAANNENTSNMIEANSADTCADDDMTKILKLVIINGGCGVMGNNNMMDTGDNASDVIKKIIQYVIEYISFSNMYNAVVSSDCCVGIQNYMFQMYLCLNEDKHAYIWEKALSYWNYD